MMAAPAAALKSTVRRSLASVMYHSGWLSRRGRVALAGRAVVLTYHRVLDDDACGKTWSHPSIVVRRETFARQMAALRRDYRILSAPEFIDLLERGGPFPPGAVLITFDDGWLDTYTQAWPVLRDLGIPATVFLPVSYVGTRVPFWQERLAGQLQALWATAHEDADRRTRIRAALETLGCAALLDQPAPRVRDAAQTAVQAIKEHDPIGAGTAMARLEDATGIPARAGNGIDEYMSWDAVREMAAGGITFGGHGVTHRQLSHLPRPAMEEEVRESVQRVRDEIGTPTTTFAYPNGDWNADTAAAVARAGVRVAFTTHAGPVAPGASAWSLSRLNMHEHVTATLPTFFARLTGAL